MTAQVLIQIGGDRQVPFCYSFALVEVGGAAGQLERPASPLARSGEFVECLLRPVREDLAGCAALGLRSRVRIRLVPGGYRECFRAPKRLR